MLVLTQQSDRTAPENGSRTIEISSELGALGVIIQTQHYNLRTARVALSELCILCMLHLTTYPLTSPLLNCSTVFVVLSLCRRGQGAAICVLRALGCITGSSCP